MNALALVIAVALGLAPVAPADSNVEARWGLSIWGLSYHTNRSVNYNQTNLGLGLRYYFNRKVFVEGDALRNSNWGLVLPVSGGVELGLGSLGPWRVSLIAAFTVAYYQNLRIKADYFRAGPVPGVAFAYGRVKTNVIIILSPTAQPIDVIVASLTVAF